MTETHQAHLRVGAWLLALVGALYVAGLLGRGRFIDPVSSPTEFAQAMASPRVIASGFVYIVAMALHALGVVIVAGGVRASAPRAAGASVALTLFSLVLTTAIIGPFVFTYPAIAKSYLQGNTGAIDIVTMAAGPLFIGSVLLEGLLITAGSIFLGWAIARSGHPKWIGVACAVSAPLYATPVPGFAAEVLGSALLLVAGVGLARQPSVK